MKKCSCHNGLCRSAMKYISLLKNPKECDLIIKREDGTEMVATIAGCYHAGIYTKVDIHQAIAYYTILGDKGGSLGYTMAGLLSMGCIDPDIPMIRGEECALVEIFIRKYIKKSVIALLKKGSDTGDAMEMLLYAVSVMDIKLMETMTHTADTCMALFELGSIKGGRSDYFRRNVYTWLEKASELGDSEAPYLIHKYKKCVTEDSEWMRLSASRGYVPAMVMLVKYDQKMAKKSFGKRDWLREAAENADNYNVYEMLSKNKV